MRDERRNTSEFLERCQELFERLLAVPEQERPALLEREAGGDPLLMEEVRSLLRHSADGVAAAASVVQRSAADLAAEMEQAWLGRKVGAWKVTGVLGRGGMGAVYEVVRDDGAYQLRAAMKIVRSEMDSVEGRRRFLEERQILARLEHPNISRLLDGGNTEEGTPYLVMEAVDGQNIVEYSRQRGLGLGQKIRLMVTAARAVQSAHQRLVVHRDLKPANILVTDQGAVKLLDFGIAKLLTPADGSEAATRPEQRVFTPEYASPEQVRGEPMGTATDIYSLGAVLFELLTGRRALDLGGKTTFEAMRAVCEVQAQAPSQAAPPQLRRKLAGDLDTIVLTALQKDPARRFQSVEQMADDLERFLAGRPIHARPDSVGYRARKFIRRHALAVSAASIAVAGLAIGVVVSTVQARRAEKRFQQVRTLANKFLFDFHESIKNLPGSLPARQLVAATALEYLDSLAADAGDERGLLFELGTAYEKVGDVLGDRHGPNLGRTADALVSYRKALDLKLRACGPTPGRPEEIAGVVSSYYKMSDALTSTGDTAKANETLQRGLDLALKSGSPQDKIAGLSRKGDLELRRGGTGAVETFEAALRIAEEKYRPDPSATNRRTLANIQARVGHARKMLSQDQLALTAFARVIDLNNQSLKENPDDVTAMREMRSAYNERGDILRSPFTPDGLRSDLSLIEYEKSRELAERIYRTEPTSFAARYAKLFARMQIADTWRELQPARGVEELRQCISDLDQLKRDNPAFKDGERLGAMLHQALGDAMIRAGQKAAAERTLPGVIQSYERLISLDPARRQLRRELSLANSDLGKLRLERGDLEGARAASAACLPFPASLDQTKARPIDLREAANCQELAGRVSAEAGDPEAARAAYGASIAFWQEFGRRGLRSRFIEDSRSRVERRLAGLPGQARGTR